MAHIYMIYYINCIKSTYKIWCKNNIKKLCKRRGKDLSINDMLLSRNYALLVCNNPAPGWLYQGVSLKLW